MTTCDYERNNKNTHEDSEWIENYKQCVATT